MYPLDHVQVIYSVGRRVAELRRNQGWTQEELAARASVTLKYLQRVEAGKENLTIYSLVRFANLLTVPVEMLFQAPTEPHPKRGRPPLKGKHSDLDPSVD